MFGICLIIFKLELKMTVPASCKRLRTLYLTFFAFHPLCHDDRINIWPHNSKELIVTALHLQMILFLVLRCIKRSYGIPPFCDTLLFPLNNILFTNCTIGLRVSFWFIFMIYKRSWVLQWIHSWEISRIEILTFKNSKYNYHCENGIWVM